MPKISVIVPVYKVEPYLSRCVDSILAQTYTDFELILIDDGSPDNCGAMCDEYAEKDNRIHVIHQENGGLSAARNSGIDWAFENSDSEYLTFIDSDDWVHTRYLEILYNTIIAYSVPISSCCYFESNKFINEIDFSYYESKVLDAKQYYREHYVNATVAWGKLYKKKCFSYIRYPVGVIHEDEFVTYKILFNSSNVVLVNKELYIYFTNIDGITKSKWNPAKTVKLEAFREQIAFFEEHHLYDLQRWKIRDYIFSCAKQVMLAEEASNYKISKQLTQTLKTELKKYHKDKIVPLSSENLWIYKLCWPYITFFYSVVYYFYKMIVGRNRHE